jgi:hypothetical protein
VCIENTVKFRSYGGESTAAYIHYGHFPIQSAILRVLVDLATELDFIGICPQC